MGIAMITFVNNYGYDSFDTLLSRNIITSDDILHQLDHGRTNVFSILKRLIKIIHKPRTVIGLVSAMKMANKLKELSRNYPDYESFRSWNDELQKVLRKNQESFEKRLQRMKK